MQPQKVKPGDTKVYTLTSLEKKEAGKLSVRPLNGKTEKKGPTEVNRRLEDPGTNWDELFADAKVFKRITHE